MSSQLLAQAKELIEQAKKAPLSLEEMQESAIKLAANILQTATFVRTEEEKSIESMIGRMVQDPSGKSLAIALTDRCFRSSNPKVVANEVCSLLNRFGIPRFLPWNRRIPLWFFKIFGKAASAVLVPLFKTMIMRESRTMIHSANPKKLDAHLAKRESERIRINLNHLGEAILGEAEAKRRLDIYLKDLKDPRINYISIKISTLYSQINPIAAEHTISILKDRLRLLYKAAMANRFIAPDGTDQHKFVNLDMEEYRDLHLTVRLFCELLDEEEFASFSAGIVLQAYLPDSFPIFKKLVSWAQARTAKGGAPIKVRIVKGANLAMERVEASLKGWPQAPYPTKKEVDANFKRILLYALEKERWTSVHIGIASHNLFDIAFGLILRATKGCGKEVSFEMLEGMAPHISRTIKELSGDLLLYCPVVEKKDFQCAISYLIRRFDENTAPENFLRHLFNLTPGSRAWHEQVQAFQESFALIPALSSDPRRTQNRYDTPTPLPLDSPFNNEPDTDWSLPQNQKWGAEILASWRKKSFSPIPIVFAGKEINFIEEGEKGDGFNPSDPKEPLYHYTLANSKHVQIALEAAVEAQKNWEKIPVQQLFTILAHVAQELRIERAELIGSMVFDGGKSLSEADAEVSEAIDFAEYYLRSRQELEALKGIKWKARGPLLIAPPWNFPCAIPAGGILAALAGSNTVIFKPARETVLVGWVLVNAFWRAGVPKEVLQFMTGKSSVIGDILVADPRLQGVILTGSTETAKHLQTLRPDLHLMAETGGKNTLIISRLADKDLAVKDLVQSAFSHAGQKCSAASLAILEAEVYDDPHFRSLLKEAIESIPVGPATQPWSRMTPLIHEPEEKLRRGLTQLEPGEEWLVKPQQNAQNPQLWSPAVKWGVRPGSFTHLTELFGPVLGVMRADNLENAIELANSSSYGLTGGIHTLDEKEQQLWAEKIEVGNCYINRGITGAIVLRQPFGGCKESGFGPGAKVGGPNYLAQIMKPEEVGEAIDKKQPPQQLHKWGQMLDEQGASEAEKALWEASMQSYAYWWERMQKEEDPLRLLGQDNFLRYIPRKHMLLRLQEGDRLVDALRVLAAAALIGTPIDVSVAPGANLLVGGKAKAVSVSAVTWTEEKEEELAKRLNTERLERLRMFKKPSELLSKSAASCGCYIEKSPVFSHGRIELLHYVREASFSIDYHRYGNLGLREQEPRKEIL